MKKLLRFTLLAAVAAFVAGCATPITVTSEPAGASVYCRGSGRAAYRWKYRGQAPVTFKVPYNAVQTFVQWPDASATKSPVRYDRIYGKDGVKIDFKK